MVMVMNHADADSGVSYTASVLPVAGLSTFGANRAITSGRDFTVRPPRFAMNMRVEVSTVISSVSLVRDEFSAP